MTLSRVEEICDYLDCKLVASKYLMGVEGHANLGTRRMCWAHAQVILDTQMIVSVEISRDEYLAHDVIEG